MQRQPRARTADIAALANCNASEIHFERSRDRLIMRCSANTRSHDADRGGTADGRACGLEDGVRCLDEELIAHRAAAAALAELASGKSGGEAGSW